MDIKTLFGVKGTCKHESRTAIITGNLLTTSLICIGIGVLIQWHMEITGELTTFKDHYMVIIVALFFVIQLSTMLLLVQDKLLFIKQNWLGLAFIIISVPTILQYSQKIHDMLEIVKPLFALAIIIPWFFHFIQLELSANQFLKTLLAIIITIILSGFLISGVDPAITTPWEGFWWAWTTIATVGYGDFVPVSNIGRIIATVLILLGIGFFSMLTANFSAMFLKSDVKSIKNEIEKEAHTEKESNQLYQMKQLHREKQLELLIVRMESRLTSIESQLDILLKEKINYDKHQKP